MNASVAIGVRKVRADADRLFYTGMALYVALVVFAGFARTYYLSHWLTQPARTPQMTSLLEIHGAIFTAWILLIVVQPWLIARSNRMLHRRLGWAGAVLAILVWISGNLVAGHAIHHGFKGVGDPYVFYAVTFFSMQFFLPIVCLAIRWRNRPDYHKRLMLLSNASILEAAVGRLPMQLVAAAAPLSFYVGADTVILAGVLYDWATRGSVHPVWKWGGGGLVLSQFLRIAVAFTPGWRAFAMWVAWL